MATPNMNLDLPVVSVTLGPEWAIELNAVLTVIDGHDHSSGFGTSVKPAGLDIDSDLDFQGNRAFNLKSSKYTDQVATLTGATNASSVYSKSGDLWWTNGSGIAVQLTSGSSIISTPSNVESFQYDSVNTNLTIGPADPYVVVNVDCSVIRTITLPSASAVSPGRIYAIKDGTNQSETNNMTITPDGADTIDLGASVLVNSNGACVFLASNGVSNWSRI
jgi:hypothetical protein